MKNKKNFPDYFYFLSKKKNYRSRAAFKLIELNKKFKFLEKASGILDLCAAPGSWLQVARNLTSTKTLVIGVDASFIKPISNCLILKGDITSKGSFFAIIEIRNFFKKEITVVLHDGAPKMGTVWSRDAYNQNILALKAFKLTILCIKKNGWFISKIFFSQNIHGFMFALNFFFSNIMVCKPKACRRSSAETYIICKGFIIPLRFENLLLKPEYIFGDYLSKKNFFFLKKHEINVKKNKFLIFLKFIRYKSKISNQMNFINFNDEYLVQCSLIIFGFVFKDKILKKKKKSQNYIFFLLINWLKKIF
jgi:AdoMet-dependent rRNA methyltransferase SPB1